MNVRALLTETPSDDVRRRSNSSSSMSASSPLLQRDRERVELRDRERERPSSSEGACFVTYFCSFSLLTLRLVFSLLSSPSNSWDTARIRHVTSLLPTAKLCWIWIVPTTDHRGGWGPTRSSGSGIPIMEGHVLSAPGPHQAPTLPGSIPSLSKDRFPPPSAIGSGGIVRGCE